MSQEIKGRVFKIEEPLTGESAKGPWKKQELIIETMDQYPKKVAFTCWNDKIKLDTIQIDSVVTVFYNAESREHSGRWYTALGAWKLDLSTDGVNADLVADAPSNEQEQADGPLPF